MDNASDDRIPQIRRHIDKSLEKKNSQGQLTVKGSSNRMLPRFQEPILG